MGKNNENLITLIGENNEEILVEVIEQTIYEGKTYLLVADNTNGEEEGDCYILREEKLDEDEVEYVVADEDEENIVFDIFEKILNEDNIKLMKQKIYGKETI